MTPDTHTNEELMLDVGDGHTLYVQDWGKKDATKPMLVLHGGPGYGLSDQKKSLFDPTQQRVIFFDQRGSGRSLPKGSIEHNDTQHQITDIDTILSHFQIEQVILTGGSWGSALALLYAIAHPERVSAMVLDGIYTLTKAENDWLDKGMFKPFYPDIWQQYLDATPEKQRDDPSAYHFARILGSDAAAVKASGYIYETLEASALSLDDRHQLQPFDTFDPSAVRVEVHYLVNAGFVPERHIFDNASKLTMPVYLVQGRYDMVCPPITAYELDKILPNCELIWTTSGHRNERETWNVKRTILKQLTA